MRLLTRADEDLFQAASLVAKLGRLPRLIEPLQDRYLTAWQDPEAAFGYALACSAGFTASESDFELQAAFSGTTEALGDVLSARPDHWPARYLRARLRAMVPTDYGGLAIVVDGARDSAVLDLTDLIERQEPEPWQPYFAASHALLALALLARGEPERVPPLLAVLAGRPATPVPFPALGSLLCEPFVELHARLDGDDAARVAVLAGSLFPGNPTVAGALARSAAC